MQDNQTMNGHWVYGAIIIPIKEIYIGMSGKKSTNQRWQPSVYKRTALQPYIEQYGWDNIHFFVFKDGLTKKQAERLEDLLIAQARLDNWCINRQGSGGEWRDNPVECRRQYNNNHKEEIKEYNKHYRDKHKVEIQEYRDDHKEERKLYDKQYYQEHKEERKQNSKQYQEAHKEERKQYDKQRNSTPAGKIYIRVKNYNRNHTPIETPLEARNKYLEYGYLPSYVKNTDLK